MIFIKKQLHDVPKAEDEPRLSPTPSRQTNNLSLKWSLLHEDFCSADSSKPRISGNQWLDLAMFDLCLQGENNVIFKLNWAIERIDLQIYNHRP